MKRKIFKFAALTMMLTAPCFVSVSFAQMLPPGINLYVSGPDALEVGQQGWYYAEGNYGAPSNVFFFGWEILAPTFSYSSSNLSYTSVGVTFSDTGDYIVRAKFLIYDDPFNPYIPREFHVDKTITVASPLEYFYPYIYTRKLNNNGLMEFYVPDIPSYWLDNCSVQWYVGGHGYLYSDFYVPLTGTFPAGLEIKCIFYYGSHSSQMGSTRVPQF